MKIINILKNNYCAQLISFIRPFEQIFNKRNYKIFEKIYLKYKLLHIKYDK